MLKQIALFIDDEEDNKVISLQKKWKISSKVETLRKIIRDFKEEKKEVK